MATDDRTEFYLSFGFDSIRELKSRSELVSEDGDGATWCVAPLDDGKWLAWEIVTHWHEVADTKEDALAMIDHQGEERDEAIRQMQA